MKLWPVSTSQKGNIRLVDRAGRRLAILVDDEVRLFDAATFEPQEPPLPRKLRSWRGGLYFSADGSRLLYSTQDATEIWRLD